MRKIGQQLVAFAFLLGLVAYPSQTQGFTPIPCDGFACLYVVLAREDIVICTQRVSGDTNRFLVAFDTAAGKVAWRRQTTDWVFDAPPGDRGEFFFIDGNTLHRCRLSDGATVEAVDLGALRWPKVDAPEDPTPRKLAGYREMLAEPGRLDAEAKEVLQKRIQELERSGGMRISFRYYCPVVTPTNFCVWRSVSCIADDSLCMRTRQWAAADRRTRETRSTGGTDEFIGRAGEDVLLLGDAFEARLLLVEGGKSREIGGDFLRARQPWRVETSYPSRADARSDGGNNLLGFQQMEAGGLLSNVNACAVYHGADGTFSTVRLAGRPERAPKWILQGSNVICCLQSTATNPASCAIESYDLQGNRIARRELPDRHGNRSVSFVGRTTRRDLVFLDTVHYGSWWQDEVPTVTGAVVVVEVPSLAVKATFSLNDGAPPQSETSCRVLAGTDRLVQVLGNGEIWKMEKASQPHRFVIRGLDAYTGKEFWRICEDVTVRKRGTDELHPSGWFAPAVPVAARAGREQ